MKKINSCSHFDILLRKKRRFDKRLISKTQPPTEAPATLEEIKKSYRTTSKYPFQLSLVNYRCVNETTGVFLNDIRIRIRIN